MTEKRVWGILHILLIVGYAGVGFFLWMVSDSIAAIRGIK